MVEEANRQTAGLAVLHGSWLEERLPLPVAAVQEQEQPLWPPNLEVVAEAVTVPQPRSTTGVLEETTAVAEAAGARGPLSTTQVSEGAAAPG